MHHHHHHTPTLNKMSIEHLKPKFYVIAVISNPVQYKSRYVLYQEFKKHLAQHGVQLFTVEVAFGDRQFVVTDETDPFSLQFRTWDELWHKENMINLAIQRLPKNWEFVAWIDADIQFHNANWVEDTLHALQHHHVVQLFQTAIDMGPTGEAMSIHYSFCYSHWTNRPYTNYYPNWHPGYAWAARREAIDHMAGDGLIDRSILGAGDRHMALSLIGHGASSVEKNLHPNYHGMVRNWEHQAEKYIRRDIGWVIGNISHFWHGKKADRRYFDRWKILVRNQFDPYGDLKRDWQGLYQLVDHGDLRSIRLRDDIRRYFRGRNEDSIDL